MSNVKKIIILSDKTLKLAMQTLSLINIKCLIVVNSKKQVIGTLTDGDVRRALVKGKSMKSKVFDICNKKFLFLLENEINKAKINSIFKKNKKLLLIPILNNSKKLMRIYTQDSIFNFSKLSKYVKETKIVIMSGGFGTRLGPITNVLPKSLLPIGSKTMIETVVDKFLTQGFKDFIFSVFYKKNLIKTYFNELKKNYKLNFLEEKKPMGTAGSLFFLKNNKNKYFIVTNCDNFVNEDYNLILNHHVKNKNDFTVVTSKKEFKLPYGSVQLDKRNLVLGIIEKPKMNFNINTGLYIINRKVIKIMKKRRLDMNEFINDCVSNGLNVGHYQIDQGSWKEIGQWSQFNDFVEKNHKK
jgi:dTDP-glucose pyrophosphorylase